MIRKRKGFTLIEVVISMAISAIVLTVITTFFITNTNSLSMADIKSTLQQEGEDIKEAMIKNGTQSDAITNLSLIDGVDNNNLKESKDLFYNNLKADGSTEISNSVGINEIDFTKFKDPANKSDVNYVKFKLNGTELSMDIVDKLNNVLSSKVLSKNVKSFRIIPSDAKSVLDAARASKPFSDTEGIKVSIELYKAKGTNKVNYPVSINIVFRNRNSIFN